MYQCDSCPEWYHGDCVGMTKELNQKMEQEGKKFICLKCQTKNEQENLSEYEKIREKNIAEREKMWKEITSNNLSASVTQQNVTATAAHSSKSTKRLSKNQPKQQKPKKSPKKSLQISR